VKLWWTISAPAIRSAISNVFPIDALKIDRSFLIDIVAIWTTPPSPMRSAMAGGLGLEVAAEGVETEQLAFCATRVPNDSGLPVQQAAAVRADACTVVRAIGGKNAVAHDRLSVVRLAVFLI
jgi:predicted signal transduction protein with EAL and GGDEF domain